MDWLRAGSATLLCLGTATVLPADARGDVEPRRTAAIVITAVGVTIGTILTAQTETSGVARGGISAPVLYGSQIAVGPSIPRFVVGTPGSVIGGVAFTTLRVISLALRNGNVRTT